MSPREVRPGLSKKGFVNVGQSRLLLQNFLLNLFGRTDPHQSCFPLIVESATTSANVTVGSFLTLFVLAVSRQM